MARTAAPFRILAIVVAASVATLLSVLPASAEKRVALVIGNGAYKNASKLPNPTNDGKAISGMLQAAGFDAVELRENLGIRELRRAISDFAVLARDADTAVVYYSGHGIEVNGVNYLIPIDAVLEQDIDVPYETFSLENLVQALEPARRLRLIMLDACRDNPFARSMKRTIGTRAIGRGLAAVEPTSVNTLIGFAAKAGSYALDGDGTNSPYAVALLNNLATPGLDLRIAFGRVRDDVLKTTKNKQEPFVYGSLGGTNVSIVDSLGASVTAVTPPQSSISPVDRAAQAWGVTKDTNSIAILEDFIRQYGSTSYGSMARARLEELKKTQPTIASPPQLAPPATAPTNDAAERAWAIIQNTTSVAVLEEFLRAYGDSFYARFARARLEELKKSQVAVVAPPTAPTAPPPQVQPTVGVFPPASGLQPLTAAQERVLKPKDSFKECDRCPEMVVVPSGSFTMGSPENELEHSEDESPQRSVKFARPFAVGRFAVTFDEWDACVADGGCSKYRPSDSGWGRGKRPVINVSWDDAKAYVAWLSRKTGKPYRLLSEAEREYVTRAGTTSSFWWGSSITPSQANYDGSYAYGDGPKGEYRAGTVPVDSFQPNPWGLYQVHGNVYDWVEDCYGDSYAGLSTDGSALAGENCSGRVLRGGSWNDAPQDLRSANRLGNPADLRLNYSGFRLARTLTP